MSTRSVFGLSLTYVVVSEEPTSKQKNTIESFEKLNKEILTEKFSLKKTKMTGLKLYFI